MTNSLDRDDSGVERTTGGGPPLVAGVAEAARAHHHLQQQQAPHQPSRPPAHPTGTESFCCLAFWSPCSELKAVLQYVANSS